MRFSGLRLICEYYDLELTFIIIMVFQDNELIGTIRVDKWRSKMNIFQTRKFNAAGGYPTSVLAFSSGAFMYHFAGGNIGHLKNILTPQRNNAVLLTACSAGLAAYIAGYYVGTVMFGNRVELKNLNRNSSQYKAEMKSFQKELYPYA